MKILIRGCKKEAENNFYSSQKKKILCFQVEILILHHLWYCSIWSNVRHYEDYEQSTILTLQLDVISKTELLIKYINNMLSYTEFSLMTINAI